MTCETCGEKPNKCGNCNKDFPRAVIEIDNPETLVLLRKVVIPVSMGTEEQVPTAIGKYHNVLLQYEANGHIYLYSSDGIPTAITANIPQEVLDSIEELEDDVVDLQEQIDDLKNSPDVVDIVATYADLQTYDTSSLGDKDIIRVLEDETHDGESSYYRWDATTQTWTFIGATGPYYTKSETDTLIDAAKGSAKELTSDDYNWPTDNPDGIAAWTLDPGFYRTSRGTKIYWTSSSQGVNSAPFEFIVAAQGNSGDKWINLLPDALYLVQSDGSETLHTTFLKMNQIVDDLTTASSTVPLSANQGKVLKDTIGNLSDLTTTDKSDLVAAINEAASGGGSSGLITLSYGASTWQDFIDAYNAGEIVYCRASSNSNPATGTQTRMAFMAYINNPTTPTEVEFQYVRSVSNKTASQQMDQVFVYKLTSANGGTWTVATRDMTSKIAAGANMTNSYSNNTLTLDCAINPSYSTIEEDTGATWIDGNKIYKKTINTGTLPNSSTKTVQHGVGTILKRAIRIEGYAYSPTYGINMSMFDPEISVQVAGADIEIVSSSDLSTFTESYVTLYYTKTQ